MHKAHCTLVDKLVVAHDKDKTTAEKTLEKQNKKGAGGGSDAEKKLTSLIDSHKAKISDIVADQTKVNGS